MPDVVLPNATRSLAEDVNTSISLKLSDIVVAAAAGSTITLSGIDANSFEVVGQALYLKAGVVLDYESRTAYAVTLNVVDASTHSVTGSLDYILNVTDVDEIPALVSNVRIASATHADGALTGALQNGDTLTLEVQMTRAVVLSGGNATLVLNVGGQTKQATYNGLSSDGTLLTFSYVVPDGVLDANGIGFDANSFGLAAGATLATSANLLTAVLTHSAVAEDAAYTVAPHVQGFYSSTFDMSTFQMVTSYSSIVGAAMVSSDTTDYLPATMPNLKGMAVANGSVVLSWAGGAAHTVVANSTGAWSYTLNHTDLTSIGMGNHTLTVSYTDANQHTVATNWDVLINAQAEVSLKATGSGYGSDYVDALIATNAGWQYGPISYSFASLANGSDAEWTEVEKQSFRDSCQLYANISNLTFVEGVFNASSAYSTNINLYKYDSSHMVGGADAGAEFYQPIDSGFGNAPIQGHFNIDYWSAPANGTYAQYATIHELGHGLGLDHPFDASQKFPEVTTYPDLGTNQLNTGMWTVMAYNFGWDVQGLDYSTGIPGDDGYGYGYAMTPMTFDVAAIQQLYGVNTTYKTGDDTYVIPTALGAGEGWVCIWDAGGNDTISNAGSIAACSINLNAYPKEGGLPSAAYVSYAAGTPAGFTIADGATIENAIGGSGADVLIGNAGSNQLTGGIGADKFAFATALGVNNIDTLVDFSVSQGDVMELSHTIFAALTGLTDLTLNFVAAANAVAATTVDDFLIYNTTTGALYYDQDGSATAYAAVEFAVLQTKPMDVSAAQFLVI